MNKATELFEYLPKSTLNEISACLSNTNITPRYGEVDSRVCLQHKRIYREPNNDTFFKRIVNCFRFPGVKVDIKDILMNLKSNEYIIALFPANETGVCLYYYNIHAVTNLGNTLICKYYFDGYASHWTRDEGCHWLNSWEVVKRSNMNEHQLTDGEIDLYKKYADPLFENTELIDNKFHNRFLELIVGSSIARREYLIFL